MASATASASTTYSARATRTLSSLRSTVRMLSMIRLCPFPGLGVGGLCTAPIERFRYRGERLHAGVDGRPWGLDPMRQARGRRWSFGGLQSGASGPQGGPARLRADEPREHHDALRGAVERMARGEDEPVLAAHRARDGVVARVDDPRSNRLVGELPVRHLEGQAVAPLEL